MDTKFSTGPTGWTKLCDGGTLTVDIGGIFDSGRYGNPDIDNFSECLEKLVTLFLVANYRGTHDIECIANCDNYLQVLEIRDRLFESGPSFIASRFESSASDAVRDAFVICVDEMWEVIMDYVETIGEDIMGEDHSSGNGPATRLVSNDEEEEVGSGKTE